jgi:hypothetical protein
MIPTTIKRIRKQSRLMLNSLECSDFVGALGQATLLAKRNNLGGLIFANEFARGGNGSFA